MPILRKYATASTVNFPLIALGTVNFTSTATLTTADLKISVDGGAFGTVGTAITNVGSYGYSYSLTTANLTGKLCTMVIISTAATKVCEDSMILIETYGNSGAQHTFDLSIANQTVIASAGTVTLSANQSVIASAGTVTLTAAQVVTVGTNNDKTGYSLSQTFPANFSALSITAVTGLVSISTAATVVAGTVSDKTGYSLTQTFPTNFADLSITATTGLVAISTAATVNCGTIASGAVTSIWGIAAVPATGVPTWTASMLSSLSWMFGLSRNRVTQTSVLQTVLQSDGATTLATSTLSDDATTFVKGSFN